MVYVQSIVDKLRAIHTSESPNDEFEAFLRTIPDEIFDIDYVLDCFKQLKGVRINVSGNGVICWINTDSGTVCGYWGCDDYSIAFLDDTICDWITEYMNEHYYKA